MRTLFIVGAVVLSLLGCKQLDAFRAQSDWPPVVCSNPCVIKENSGGIIDLFAAQGRLMASTHIPVIIDGPCLSACTVFVDIDRDNVCVTNNAILGYHKSIYYKTSNFATEDNTPVIETIDYTTPGLMKYIKDHGGEPDPSSGHLLMLNAVELHQFYKAC